MTESPEIKTYTPEEAQVGGEGKPPAPDGLYIQKFHARTYIVCLAWRAGTLFEFDADYAQHDPANSGFDPNVAVEEYAAEYWNVTFTGPISLDEVIPAVIDHRQRKRLEEIQTNQPVVQAAIAEKAHRVAGDTLRAVLHRTRPAAAAKARYPDGRNAREVAWLASLFLETIVANLCAGKYLAAGLNPGVNRRSEIKQFEVRKIMKTMKLLHGIRYAIAKVKTFMLRGRIKKAHKQGKMHAWLMALVGTTPAGPESWQSNQSKHPHHNQGMRHLQEIADERELSKLLFGDSISAIPADQLQSISADENYALSGNTSFGIQQTVEDAHQILADRAKVGFVRHIVIGTFGNDLWTGLPYAEFKRRVSEALRVTRTLFPSARIHVLGLPPSYSPVIQAYRYEHEGALVQWAQADGNARVISFHKLGFWAPSIWHASDGVHLTDLGVVRYDRALAASIESPRDAEVVVFA